MRTTAIVLIAGCLLIPAALAKGGSHSSGHSASSHHATHESRKATGVARDSSGRIHRDPQARRSFEKSHPCPSTGRTSGACPGYVVDHITPLKRGGADVPGNMQWQSVDAARAKDSVE